MAASSIGGRPPRVARPRSAPDQRPTGLVGGKLFALADWLARRRGGLL